MKYSSIQGLWLGTGCNTGGCVGPHCPRVLPRDSHTPKGPLALQPAGPQNGPMTWNPWKFSEVKDGILEEVL